MSTQLLFNLITIRHNSDRVAKLLNSHQTITIQLFKNNDTKIIKGKPKSTEKGVIEQITDKGKSISDSMSYQSWVQDERETEQEGDDDEI